MEENKEKFEIATAIAINKESTDIIIDILDVDSLDISRISRSSQWLRSVPTLA